MRDFEENTSLQIDLANDLYKNNCNGTVPRPGVRAPTIQDIPSDLRASIYESLSGYDLVNLSKVNRFFRKETVLPELWRRKIENGLLCQLPSGYLWRSDREEMRLLKANETLVLSTMAALGAQLLYLGFVVAGIVQLWDNDIGPSWLQWGSLILLSPPYLHIIAMMYLVKYFPVLSEHRNGLDETQISRRQKIAYFKINTKRSHGG